jgi:hypothetical protein
LIYVAALLILHDGEAAIRGTGIITENIWPKEWWSWAIQFFDPHVITDDRSDFIEAAIRHVEADLNNLKPAETGGNAVYAKLRKIWMCVRRIPRWIYVLVIFLAALLGIFEKFGCLEPIKTFIHNILWPK